MENKDGTRQGIQSLRGFTRINRNILVFAFFLVLSFIFWYLNSLSKEMDITISYPVRYTSVPTGKTLSADLPASLLLVLKGHGYSIIKLKMSGKGHPLEINLSEISYYHTQDGRPDDNFIITAPLINSFDNQLMSECRIMSVKPDTLFFSFKK